MSRLYPSALSALALFLCALPVGAEQAPPNAAEAELAQESPTPSDVPKATDEPKADMGPQEAGPETAPAPAPNFDGAMGRMVRLVLRDGSTVRAHVVHATPSALTLALSSGQTRTVDVEHVTELTLESAPSASLQASHGSHYLLGPSARMLNRGDVLISQKGLLLTELQAGVTDHVSLQVGTVIPYWFINFAGSGNANFTVGLQVGGQLSEEFHLAVGAQSLWMPGYSGVVHAMGVATWGGEERHLTLSVGLPTYIEYGRASIGNVPSFNLSGSLQLNPKRAFVTENWIFPDFQYGSVNMFFANGVRLIGKNTALDLGIVLLLGSSRTGRGATRVKFLPIPVAPWLGFTYSF